MRRCRPLLGTFVEIEAEGETAIEAGFAAIARVHALMSAHEPMSELARLNRSAPGAPVHLSGETLAVLQRALSWWRASGGLFDPAIAGARAIYRNALPLHPGQTIAVADSTLADLRLIGSFAWLERPGCIDLGGIAKGFAVDSAIDAMKDARAASGLVNAGGDMATFGRARAIEIVDPVTRQPRLRMQIADRALATSAGLPAQGQLDHAHLPSTAFASVTVEAARCVDADALTKIAFAGGDMAPLLSLADARAVALTGTGIIELGLDKAA